MNNNYGFSRFFSSLQDTSWYLEFLKPVVDEIPAGSYVLDVGTGPGKLPELLYSGKTTRIIGVDTSSEMLSEARLRLAGTDILLALSEPNQKLPFESESFDCITLCNVLFNLGSTERALLVSEVIRLMKSDGKIIILTPTGRGNPLRLLIKPGIRGRFKLLLWYVITRRNARYWTGNNGLKPMVKDGVLDYSFRVVFYGLGRLEIISRKKF